MRFIKNDDETLQRVTDRRRGHCDHAQLLSEAANPFKGLKPSDASRLTAVRSLLGTLSFIGVITGTWHDW